jgi:hypothetical protein
MKKLFTYLILAVPLTIFASPAKLIDPVSRIDITGNWQDGSFKPVIQTREPELKSGEAKTFSQEIKLPKGNYTILFEYEPTYDRTVGGLLRNNFDKFNGFKINGLVKTLVFTPVNTRKEIYTAQAHFAVENSSLPIHLELSIHNTRVIRTWLQGSSLQTNNKSYFAVSPRAGNEYLLIHQIPFLVRKTDNMQYGIGMSGKHPTETVDRGALQNAKGEMTFELGGSKVNKLHFLGMIHKIDVSNGAWYAPKGDNGYAHFIGDKAGEIVLTYQNNKTAIIPLIFGFNIWFGRPWDMLWFHYPKGSTELVDRENFDAGLFSGDPEPRTLIENTVALSDGTRQIGSRSSNTRFIFSIDAGNQPIKSVEIKGVDDMYGYPLVTGITVETAAPSPVLKPLPDLGQPKPAINPVTVQYIVDGKYKPGIEKLKRAIYSFKDELPKLKEPEIPEGYFGPRYDFKGTQEAVYAATYLFRNGPECGAKIADDGTTCSSTLARSRTLRYMLGTGIWIGIEPLFGDIQNWFTLYKTREPGQLPGAGNAWSRGIGELMREAMSFGYGKFINSYTSWLDSTLLHEASPPHWIRIAGKRKESGAWKERKVGDVIETGNRENDGHGICMMGRYMAYHWQGHPQEWNRDHWQATKAAVDWIKWQLETDTIFPGKRIDLLYTESESGSYEFYSSYNCLHGLQLYIKMAQELGKTAEVEEWTTLYNRLQKGILDHAVRKSEFGPIWYTNSEHWMDEAHKLAHIQLATDGITYTPLQDYAVGDEMQKKYLEIDRNTYKYVMRDKNYNCLRMYGYGQGMMVQSALLMDQMYDAEQFINVMVDHCYLPKMEGWAAPEGIMLHKSGEYWMPICGYLGQDSHLADSQKGLRVMLGVDDNNPDYLRLVPRFPASWNQAGISDFPVLIGRERKNLSYSYNRTEGGQDFSFNLDTSVNKMSLRLGPIPNGKEVSAVTLNGGKVDFEKLASGDSHWIWVHGLSGKAGQVQLKY